VRSCNSFSRLVDFGNGNPSDNFYFSVSSFSTCKQKSIGFLDANSLFDIKTRKHLLK